MAQKTYMDEDLVPPTPKQEVVDPDQHGIFDARFDGDDYNDRRDRVRLTGQLERVYKFISDGGWHSVEEIAQATGDPATSVSAQLRNLRKERFGDHDVETKRHGEGFYVYRLNNAEG